MHQFLEHSIKNIFVLLSFLTPLILVFLFIFITIINQNIKGFVYLAGSLIASFINILLQHLVKTEKKFESIKKVDGEELLTSKEEGLCSIFDIFGSVSEYNEPASSSVFVAFTFAYLLLPMVSNNQLNYGLIIILLSIFVIDGGTKINYGCNETRSVVLGGLTGFILGTIWYTLLHMSGNDNLLYFDELNSNNILCSKPSKQKFKCSVYKNGQLISDKKL